MSESLLKSKIDLSPNAETVNGLVTDHIGTDPQVKLDLLKSLYPYVHVPTSYTSGSPEESYWVFIGAILSSRWFKLSPLSTIALLFGFFS